MGKKGQNYKEADFDLKWRTSKWLELFEKGMAISRSWEVSVAKDG